MSKRSILVLVASLAMIFGATSAFAVNSLDVNMGAAIVGVYGLEVLVDGSSNSVYVADSSPQDETVYRAEFRIRHNGVTMTEGDNHVVLLGRRGMPTQNNLFVRIARLGGTYKITARAKKDGSGAANCGKFTMGALGSRVGVEWVAASADGANDGVCRLLKNGVIQAANTTIDNDTLEIDNVRFGAPQNGVDAGTSGSYFLDDFSSFRTLAP